uniref:Endonuclease/exonuclease/phosphatase domain-containing protein n=1 Tax=Cacopsylla melanoneura TaxID=428564 RepID=A0A8D9AWN4_9HEMI
MNTSSNNCFPFIFPGNVYSSVSDVSSVSQDSQQSVESVPLPAALLQQLTPFSSSFRVAHINAQSLLSHHAYLLATFGNRTFHAILVSETWLKPSLPDVVVSIPGYNLVRNDRLHSGAGGVGIYLRDGIDFSVLICSDGNAARKIEYLLVEVRYCNKKLILGVVYRPPEIVYSEDLESLLSTFLPHFDDVIIMGDFNAHAGFEPAIS